MRLPRLSSRIASRPAKRVRSLIRVFAKHFYPRSGSPPGEYGRTDADGGFKRGLVLLENRGRSSSLLRCTEGGGEGGALRRCGMNLSLFLCWPRDRRLNLFTFFIEQTDKNFRVSGAYQLVLRPPHTTTPTLYMLLSCDKSESDPDSPTLT